MATENGRDRKWKIRSVVLPPHRTALDLLRSKLRFGHYKIKLRWPPDESKRSVHTGRSMGGGLDILLESAAKSQSTGDRTSAQ